MSKAGVEEGPWKPDFLDISISFKKGYAQITDQVFSVFNVSRQRDGIPF